ncbi:hypothetical protein [Halobellus limi]|uniref:Uncharacterized protein n=1 Tax=Halobellus limi TaxID=699433 RepID=A0A1H6BJ23_9EURY|nr:hypothetical protein [Halobellus limi]QCC49053.1 hypothetical protein DV707_14945 [Halobellus limi]SEG60385.1 hypothetical protein SAMN04488133_2861 [Halobellus limi]
MASTDRTRGAPIAKPAGPGSTALVTDVDASPTMRAGTRKLNSASGDERLSDRRRTVAATGGDA